MQEAAARKDANKKLLEEVKSEREEYTETGDLPAIAPPKLRLHLTTARAELEAAYLDAIKGFIKAKLDTEAAALEVSLANFRRRAWPHLDLKSVEIKDGFFRLEPQSQVSTRKKYAGGVEIVVIARTEAENIRLDAHQGACVIFNWERNLSELRVTRPDGNNRLESGSLATAKVTPLKPNTWHMLKWRLTPTGMVVSVNGKVVFSEQRAYNLNAAAQISVRSEKSTVDVKEWSVKPIVK